MLWWLFAGHVVMIGVVAAIGVKSHRWALLAAAIVPLVTAAVAAQTIAASSAPRTAELVWVEGLDVTIRFRLDAVAGLMTLLVSGIGALVFVYASGYFTNETGSRFPATLLAFSTAMLGLVWADSIWTLFIFWELTSVTSFLLVGHKHVDEAVRMAARRALTITGAGGLVLLAGLMVLADTSGSVRLTDLSPVAGTAAAVSAVLILIGAATKSAQVPFHVWLPGAMAAPTPVSAYLHSATMVKAGVLLVAVVAPSFAEVDSWKWLGIAFGASTMVWGAIGALRHIDAKLILAWGTVSQLGLMILLLTAGSAKATFAAVATIFAHGIFKAALFLVIGEIDVRTGTRDIRRLGRLHRSMPVAMTVAVLAGASMAGAPPLLGFMTKEAAIEAGLGLDGTTRIIVLGAIVAGSVLTVAYTVRLLIGLLGEGPAVEVAPMRPAMAVPAAILGAACVLGYVLVGLSNDIVVPAASELNVGAGSYALLAWPGLKTGFVVSLGVLAAGSVVGALASRRTAEPPAAVGAAIADGGVDLVLDRSPRLIGFIQHGSLPVYLATLATAMLVAAIPFATDATTDHLVWWDSPLQAVLAGAVAVAAGAGAFIGSRFGAALTLGAVGVAMTGLFVLHGAPDLALTQILVETVIVVGFVLGLGRLSRSFPAMRGTWRNVRITIAALGGIAVMVGLAAAGSAPTGRAPVDDLVAGSVDEGGGKNVVNVILTDLRALDTLGEVVVLATVATGILALARASRNEHEVAQ